MADKAKLIKIGTSKAVRLPAQYRFEGGEVYIRRDLLTGDVMLTGIRAKIRIIFKDNITI